MPEVGTVKVLASGPSVWVQAWAGYPPTLVQGWMPAAVLLGQTPGGIESFARLGKLPDGTVIDVKALPEIVVRKEAPASAEPATQLDDSSLAALLEEAEAVGEEVREAMARMDAEEGGEA